MRRIVLFLCIMITIVLNSCVSIENIFLEDPYPGQDENTVWIYDSPNMQIYYIPKGYSAYIYKNREIKITQWNFGSGQSMEIQDEDGSLPYRGHYRATEEKFWLLNNNRTTHNNNLFTKEEMEAEPTFYRYYMDDLPEDTPQEVLDYIAELGEEESIDTGEESTVEDETSPTEE